MQNNLFDEKFKTAFSSLLQATFNFQTAYEKVIKNVAKTFSQIFKNLEIPSEAIDNHKYLSKLTEIEFPLHMYYKKSFFENVISKPKDELTKYIYDYFNHRRLTNMYKYWEQMKHIKKDRLSILKEAIDLHKKGFYGASVSILMCQFSGIIQDNYKFLKKQGAKFDDEFISDILKEFDIKKKCKNNDKSRLCQQLSYITQGGFFQYKFLQYLNKYVINSTKTTLKTNPNRNKICHGEFLNYNTLEHSLKSILIIDGLLKIPDLFVSNQIN